jgi:hypothetical protein
MHWETYYVAKQFPLARGWERQVDLDRNAVLYAPLTEAAYHRWLDQNAVRYVALPDAPLDPSGQNEAALLRTPPAWLAPVYADSHWRVWEVTDSTGLASGVGHLTDVDTASFTIQTDRAGWTEVRLHWTGMWHTNSPAVCLAPTVDGWTGVLFRSAGQATVDARLALPGSTDASSRACEQTAGSP